MTVNQKPTGIAVSMPGGLTWGTLSALGMTLGMSVIVSKLIDNQVLSWSQSGYAVLLILIVSAWIGSTVAACKVKRKRGIACFGCGALYFIVLLAATGLFFGGQYSGVGETALLIFCGSMLAFFTGFGHKTGRKRGKRRVFNR